MVCDVMVWEWLPGAMDSLVEIEPYEVMQVVHAERRWPRLGVKDFTGLPVLTVWGRTRAGRPLMVASRSLGGLDRQIVAVRELRPAELAEFEKWEATR